MTEAQEMTSSSSESTKSPLPEPLALKPFNPSAISKSGMKLRYVKPGFEKTDSNPFRNKKGAKIFQCTGFGDCKMAFSRSEHLSRHVRKHTGERPFHCNCGRAFSRLDNLRQHVHTVHAKEQHKYPTLKNAVSLNSAKMIIQDELRLAALTETKSEKSSEAVPSLSSASSSTTLSSVSSSLSLVNSPLAGSPVGSSSAAASPSAASQTPLTGSPVPPSDTKFSVLPPVQSTVKIEQPQTLNLGQTHISSADRSPPALSDSSSTDGHSDSNESPVEPLNQGTKAQMPPMISGMHTLPPLNQQQQQLQQQQQQQQQQQIPGVMQPLLKPDSSMCALPRIMNCPQQAPMPAFPVIMWDSSQSMYSPVHPFQYSSGFVAQGGYQFPYAFAPVPPVTLAAMPYDSFVQQH